MDYDKYDDNQRKASKRRKFNKRLSVKHLIVSEDDDSFRASLIRTMATGMSLLITPRQLISTLFILATYTIIFLVTTIMSNIIFVYFELFNELSEDVSMKLGIYHDAKLRVFGTVFALVAIMVELDTNFIGKKIAILKSFIPRSILLFLVATLSETNPMIAYEGKQTSETFSDDNSGTSYDDAYNTTNYEYNDDIYAQNNVTEDNNPYYMMDEFAYYNYYVQNQGYQLSSTENYIRDELPSALILFHSISATLL